MAINVFTYTIIIIYAAALLLILLYSLSQFHLLLQYLKAKRHQVKTVSFENLPEQEIPFVTVQLPVYNEMYVMERLLSNIVLLDYPRQKLEIQVLDDSTDESVATTAALVAKLQKDGLNIRHIHRKERTGFKAGALKEGLQQASGSLIAIFDADFLPAADWLKKTVPHFTHPDIGVVQTRWGHLNRNYSLLTRIQAFALDAHFTIEQLGRNAGNHFINFNGTAGIWRKECIYDAGNWQGDTLTEDLDLSYRAQLKNWKFVYLENVETPAELPVVISAARSQQFRWNKGGAENFRKQALKVLRASHLPWSTRIHGFLHLLNSSMFICAFLVSILSIPMLYIKNAQPDMRWLFAVFALFIISTLLLFLSYWFSYRSIQGGGIRGFLRFIRLFFTFYTVVLGFTLHNSIAVLEGLSGKRSEFVRTPKFNIQQLTDSWKGNKYISTKITPQLLIEGLLALYFLFGMYSAWKLEDFGLFPFHLMLFIGFSFVFYQSLKVRL